jgi:hypothetical protein
MASDDGRENQFYSTQSGDDRSLPLDIGGAFIYQTGIAGRASDYLGGYVMEWDVEFRGLRLSDNVTNPRPPLRVERKSDPEILNLSVDKHFDGIVLLDGKEYIRIGEAKNPGPEDQDDEDAVEPPLKGWRLTISP